jgi:hypothetical protein
MRREVAIVIKVYESMRDGHAAFEDPTTPANTCPRESIEIRTLALF